MVKTMRDAKSLSWTSQYRWTGENGVELGHCSYDAKLKKPKQFRVDTTRADGKKGGVLIGDGRDMWIHWPNGSPFFSTEECDIIVGSFMKGQRTWELWLSKRDHLPRYLKQVVH